MKAFAIFAVAKQQEGDFVIAKPEAAFWTAEEADNFFQGKSAQSVERVPTEFGPVICDVERAVFVLDLPDLPGEHATQS